MEISEESPICSGFRGANRCSKEWSAWKLQCEEEYCHTEGSRRKHFFSPRSNERTEQEQLPLAAFIKADLGSIKRASGALHLSTLLLTVRQQQQQTTTPSVDTPRLVRPRVSRNRMQIGECKRMWHS